MGARGDRSGDKDASLIDSRPTVMAGKTWEAVYCVAVVVVMFAALLKNVAGPDVLMLGALAMELAAGIVGVEDGLRGFSNKGLLTVACLFVVAAGISNGGAGLLHEQALGTPRARRTHKFG